MSESIVPCAICGQPQKVDVEEINCAIYNYSDISTSDYVFICDQCVHTDEFRKSYFKSKAYVALTAKAKIMQ
jgi:hypothetical protein